MEKLTVVSSVFGKQFSNNQANSRSAIVLLTSAIFASTALLANLRREGASRTIGNSSLAGAQKDFLSRSVVATVAQRRFLRKIRRGFIFAVAFKVKMRV